MPYLIDGTFRDTKDLRENQPIMLYELEMSAVVYMRLAEYDRDVVYAGNTYTAFPISHEAVSSNLVGEIDGVKIHVSNISREIGAVLIANDALRGKKVTMTMVFADHLDDADANLSETFYVDSSDVTETDVLFVISSKLDIFEVDIPGRRYERDQCQWEYKKEGCWRWSGAAWTAPAAFTNEATDCDKTLAGLKGCRLHKNSKRFGGFPSISSRGLYVL
jgi:lambda family phage minor tail protein L